MTEDRHCLVVDRQPVVRLGISKLLASRFEVEEAADWNAARDLLTEIGAFDVAVVDSDCTGSGEPVGVSLIRLLRRERPGLGIVAYARRPDPIAATLALDAGATCFVAKSSPAKRLLKAVEAAADRDTYVDPDAKASDGSSLTKRQREILQLLANGHSTVSAAEHLGLGAETIRTHTKAALARLEARDRTHAVAIGLRSGVIE